MENSSIVEDDNGQTVKDGAARRVVSLEHPGDSISIDVLVVLFEGEINHPTITPNAETDIERIGPELAENRRYFGNFTNESFLSFFVCEALVIVNVSDNAVRCVHVGHYTMNLLKVQSNLLC